MSLTKIQRGMLGTGAVIVPENIFTTAGTPTSSTFLAGDGTWKLAVTTDQALYTSSSVTFSQLSITNDLTAYSLNINNMRALGSIRADQGITFPDDTNISSASGIAFNTQNADIVALGRGTTNLDPDQQGLPATPWTYGVFLGVNAGANSPGGANSGNVAVGYKAGENYQGSKDSRYEYDFQGRSVYPTYVDQPYPLSYAPGVNYSVFNDGPAIAIGPNASKDGQAPFSISIGSESSALGISTIAIGNETSADYLYSTALGYRSKANNDNSIAIGQRASALHTGSIVINALNQQISKFPEQGDSFINVKDPIEVQSQRPNSFYVAPIRQSTSTYVMYYNSSSYEVTYALPFDPDQGVLL
jgi:hypothetical protein